MQKNIEIKKFSDKLKISDLINAYTLYRDNKTRVIIIKNAKS